MRRTARFLGQPFGRCLLLLLPMFLSLLLDSLTRRSSYASSTLAGRRLLLGFLGSQCTWLASAHDDGEDGGGKKAVLRVLTVGDSITSGGGYPVRALDWASREEETDALMATFGGEEPTLSAVLTLLRPLEGIESELAALPEVLGKQDPRARLSSPDLARHVAPILYGHLERAASYRPILYELLRAADMEVEMVGEACRACREPWPRLHGTPSAAPSADLHSEAQCEHKREQPDGHGEREEEGGRREGSLSFSPPPPSSSSSSSSSSPGVMGGGGGGRGGGGGCRDEWLRWHGCPHGLEAGHGHLAFWSWRARDILQGNANQPQRGKLADWLSNELSYDVALVHLGTNDLFRGHAPDAVAEDLKEIVNLLAAHQPLAQVFIAEVIPAEPSWHPLDVSRLNAAIRHAFTANPGNVWVVSQYQDFNPRLHTIDGVHPNEHGARRIANTWFAALQQAGFVPRFSSQGGDE